MISKWTVNNLARAVMVAGYPMRIDIPDTEEIPNNKDYERCAKLATYPANSGHCNFLKGINVFLDVNASCQWWAQAGRYRDFTIVSSQSKMHRALQMDMGKQLPCADPYIVARIRTLQTDCIEGRLNFNLFLENLPIGFMLKAGVTTNYMQLKTMYNQRKNHALPEWKTFIKWVEELPYSNWITGEE